MRDATHHIELHLTNDQELYHAARSVVIQAIGEADEYPMLDAADALAEWLLDRQLNVTLDRLEALSFIPWQVSIIRDLLPRKGDVEWRQIVEALFDDDELTELLDGKPAF